MTTPTRRHGDGAAPALFLTGRTATVVLAAVLTASFMELLDATIVSVAAPAIAQDLGAGQAALQWMLAGYTLSVGAGLITGGRIGDLYGRRRVFLLGLAAFMLASAGCGLAPSPGALVGMRVAQGLAGGLMIPQVFGVIRASFEPGARARALGAYGAVLGLASVAGPLLGGLLVEADLFGLGWRAIFWVNVPIAIIALIVGARAMPESRSPGRTRLDLTGAVFFGALGSFFLLLSLYLQLGAGRTALETGLVILPYAVGSIITSGIGVRFAHRAGRALLVYGALLLAASQVVLLLIVGDGGEPSSWELAMPLFMGGLGLGLTAPSLINVVLAGVPAQDAGAAGGVLTTITQIGNALGVAVLGVVFFARLDGSLRDGASGLVAYGDALATILPWQIACYAAAAALMFLLPKNTHT
ncbi:MFS transporter [Nonomuraea sp. NPDC003754]